MNPIRLALHAILPACLIDVCETFNSFTSCACMSEHTQSNWYPKNLGSACAHHVLSLKRTQPVVHQFHSSLQRQCQHVIFTNPIDNEIWKWVLSLQAALLHCEVHAHVERAAPFLFKADAVRMSIAPRRAHGALDIWFTNDLQQEAPFSFANQTLVRTVRALPRRKRKIC